MQAVTRFMGKQRKITCNIQTLSHFNIESAVFAWWWQDKTRVTSMFFSKWIGSAWVGPSVERQMCLMVTLWTALIRTRPDSSYLPPCTHTHISVSVGAFKRTKWTALISAFHVVRLSETQTRQHAAAACCFDSPQKPHIAHSCVAVSFRCLPSEPAPPHCMQLWNRSI